MIACVMFDERCTLQSSVEVSQRWRSSGRGATVSKALMRRRVVLWWADWCLLDDLMLLCFLSARKGMPVLGRRSIIT